MIVVIRVDLKLHLFVAVDVWGYCRGCPYLLIKPALYRVS